MVLVDEEKAQAFNEYFIHWMTATQLSLAKSVQKGGRKTFNTKQKTATQLSQVSILLQKARWSPWKLELMMSINVCLSWTPPNHLGQMQRVLDY